MLDGGLSKNFKIVKDAYMDIPLDISLQDTKNPLEDVNLADFSDVKVSTDYYVQLYLSEYLIQSLSNALFYSLNQTIYLPAVPLNGATQWAFMQRFSKKLQNAEHGPFSTDAPCQFLPYFAESPPIFNLTKDGFILDAEVYIDA